MKKEQMEIGFADGTKGLLSMETIKGRVDVKAEPEYIGVEYPDPLHMDNWEKYLLDTLYDGEYKRSEIFIVVSGEHKVIGWFWIKKGAEQFQRLHGGEIIKVSSSMFYLEKIRNMYQEIIRCADIDGMCITSQLIHKGYRITDKTPASYIFDCLQEYCYLFETDTLFRMHFGIKYSVTLNTYLKLTNKLLDKNADIEKTLLAFCMNMLYVTDYAVFNFLLSVLDKSGHMIEKKKLNSFYGKAVSIDKEEEK